MHHDQPNWPDAIAGRIFPHGFSFSSKPGNPFRLALDLAPCPIILSKLEGLTIEWANPPAFEFLQVEKTDLPGFVLADFVPERELPRFWQSMSDLQKGIRRTATLSLSAEDGVGICKVELAVSAEHVVAIGQSIPPGGQAAVLPTDALTGLPDRRVLGLRVEEALQRNRQDWGLLFVDLNDFKEVNDRHGHVVGDQVLVDFARKLQASSRPNDLVVRYGGDEFVVLADRVPAEQELRSMAQRIVREVVGRTNADKSAGVTCSVGCAMAGSYTTAEQVIAAADRDMYRQKRDAN